MTNPLPGRRRFLTAVGAAAAAAAINPITPKSPGSLLLGSEPATALSPSPTFIRVSPRDPRYFEHTDGKPYIPVGFNLVGSPAPEEMERVVTTMADNGVNYCRIWLDLAPWNIEHVRSGEYDADKAVYLDKFLGLCRARDIRVKMCVEWFRTIVDKPAKPPRNGSNPKPMHHLANGGFYRDMTDYLVSEKGRAQYKAKLKWYADRYGDEPTIFAWELWNEMNAVQGPWHPWTQEMLPELHRLFPKNLCVQSLGSFDGDYAREQYRLLCQIPGNDVHQVHRYLDQGAKLDVCHGPIDLLAADAVGELRAMGTDKPIILTETGAVKPRHTGASLLYAKDHEGDLLHDMLFAPFFAGAAGSGHCWFWREAIDRPSFWRHFQRFQRAVEGIDPPAEGFEPLRVDASGLRIHALRGRQTLLAWCRDASNDWKTELEDGAAPREVTGAVIDLSAFQFGSTASKIAVAAYDPWTDRSTPLSPQGKKIELPAFRRSIVLRVTCA